jgi:CBS domain-containing protein
MNPKETHRTYAPLERGEFVESPVEMPELVSLDDPASHVFTDFTHKMPVMISPHVSIDSALNRMKTSGVRLLLVVSDTEAAHDERCATVIGQITACDIMGDIPIKIARSSGLKHSEITVNMMMTPREDIQVVEWSHIKAAKVGHVVATMHHRDGCHILVTEQGMIRGIFSMNEISRKLGHDETGPAMCASSLAELVHRIG